MDITAKVVSLIEYKLHKQRITNEESNKIREALFIGQHSDDDSFANENEFEFTEPED